MIWIGLAIVVVTFYLIYKNYEARLVLALSGLVMAFIGQVVVGTNGGVSAAVDAFVKQLVNGGLVPTIVTVMGSGHRHSRRRHHYLAAEHRTSFRCWYRRGRRCSADSGFNRPESASCDGRCRSFHRNLGFGCQPGLDVQPADCRYSLQS